MKMIKRIFVGALVPLIFAGCASTPGWTTSDPVTWCAVSGAVAGGTAGGLADDSVAFGAVVGAATGAAFGAAMCTDGNLVGDSDGDGVPDSVDQCAGTPSGAPVDSVGCPLDSDGDGIPDYADACPNTAVGASVDEQGCPSDSDRDGIADSADACPNTPLGSPVDSTGCAIEAAIVTINFAFDSDELTSKTKGSLDTVVDILQRGGNSAIQIEGYTDSTGPAEYNDALSLRRANSVASYLISQGVSADRLSTIGLGESNPLVSNDTPAGRAVNRRAEFKSAQ